MNGNTAILMRQHRSGSILDVKSITVGENRHLARLLMARARELVNSINRVAGEAILYLSECVNMWMLFGRPSEEDVDRMLMHGFTDAEDLARLVVRLEQEIRTVEGTFASAAGGRGSEQKGVAAVAEREGAEATDTRCGNGNRDAGPYKKERVRV